MSDFRIGGRGGHRQGGVNRNDQLQPQAPRPRDGGPQDAGATSGFNDTISPELQARFRQRRPPAPPTGADGQRGFEPTGRDRRGPHGQPGFEGPHGRHGFGGPEGRQGPGGPLAPADPAAAATELFTRFDTDGDGNVTKAEVTAVLEAEEAKRQAQAVTVAPAETDAIAEPVVEDATESTTPAVDEAAVAPDETVPVVDDTTVAADAAIADDATATDAVPTAADLAETQATYVAQLQAIQQTEGLTDEQKTLVDTALTAVQALDPSDTEFVSKLEAALAPLG